LNRRRVSRRSKGSRNRSSCRSRSRTASPAEFRSWVTGHVPEDIRAELLQRIRNLDALAKPLWTSIRDLTRQLAITTLGTMGVAVNLPQLSPEQDRALARHAVANIAAEYWRQHEYRPGVLLPALQTVGVPWDVAQDRIHVLDLPPQVIRAALAAAAKSTRRLRNARGRDLEDPITQFQFQVSAALSTIRQLGPWALGSALPLITLLRCLVLARYSPSREEALVAAEAADTLLEALRPDLSRRMSRTPHHLGELRKRFVEIHQAVLELHDGLRASGPTRSLLTRARQRFGAMVTMQHLRRWRSMDPLVIARQLVAQELPRSKKAVRDLLALAERLEETDTAWMTFVEYVKTLPEDQQRQLLTALPVLVPPESEKPAPNPA
jgi:hypothetical protein